uniref:Uncharacterized protein n=1 Tax=Neolamprologus brichardi TaxID=32507 RepID=A0A3Q4HXZ3_NEOBR
SKDAFLSRGTPGPPSKEGKVGGVRGVGALILKDFNACQVQGCRCRQEPRSSQFSEVLHVHNWSVSYAPDPQNVRWYVRRLRPPETLDK